MQFYDSSGKSGIVDDIFYLIFGDSGDHTADYPLVDIARSVNRWYDKCVSIILQSDDRWEWDDTNKTDLPIARLSLVSGQQDYGVSAATYLKIRKVDIKDANGNSLPLESINLDQLRGRADADFLNTAGTPRYYRLQGNSMFLYPKPNYSRTASSTDWGIRIFHQRNVSYFVSTDTTKIPGFAEMFHRILSLGGAYDYAIAKGLLNAAALRGEIEVMKKSLQEFYSSRNKDTKVRIKPRELRGGLAI